VKRRTTVWIVGLGLSTWMLLAEGKVGLAPAGSPAPSVPLQAESHSRCAQKKVALDVSAGFATTGLAAQTDPCADSIDKCYDPVKYLGANGDCACFACEYGKSTQHNVCTRNPHDKDTLLRRAR